MTDPDSRRPFRDRLLREAGGELVVAATYVGAWLFAPWLPDRVLLALVVAVALQFFVVTMVVGAITPRGARGIAWSVVGHALVFALLLWVASAGGRQRPDLLAVALAHAPLLLRSVARRARPADEPPVMWLEMLGPFFLLMPVLAATVVLAAVLPDFGLAGRVLRFEHLAPLEPDQLKFALLGGAVYFALYAVARTAWESLGGELHRRGSLDPATIRRWREDYRRSRGR
jgi:hypothetical protein